MKKLLILPALFMCLSATAQINTNFIKSEALRFNQLLDFKLEDYKFYNYASELRPSLQTMPVIYNFNEANEQIWMGNAYSSDINWYNLKINATHHYDINGNLRRSSWSVKIK